MNPEVSTKNEVATALINLSSKLEELISEVDSQILTLNKNDLVLHTKLQLIFNYKPGNVLEHKILEIILNHAMAAEKLGPGAFDETIRMTLEYLKQSRRGNHQVIKNKFSNEHSSLATVDDVETLVIHNLEKSNTNIASMTREAISLAGFGGRILVEKTNNAMSSVELVRGYTFETSPAWPVSARLDEARAFVIDGYIESVSEIHHLLSSASEAKETAVMFVRGLSEEVIHTLKINYDRGTLKMIPILVKFDLDGINTVNDIAIVSGCNLVSSNKGDLISSIKYEEAPRLKSVIVYPNKVVIHHDNTSKNVAIHVATLRKKRSEPSVVDDVGNLYDKRIRTLSPNHVIIRLINDKDYVKNSQAIDIALRTIKTIVDHGVLNDCGILIPYSTKIASAIHASKCHDTLTNLGSIISS